MEEPKNIGVNSDILVESPCNVNNQEAKVQKERTEPLSGYSYFVKDEKHKIGKSKLNMREVNERWRNLIPSEKERYNKMSKDDKISLGLNYRKNRLRKNVSQKASKDKIEETVVTETKHSSEGKQTDTAVQIVSLSSPRVSSSHKEPTLCSLLTEVKDLDSQIIEKIAEKEKQGQEFFRLKLDSEVKVLELSEIDSNIAQFRSKCDVLKRKLLSVGKDS